MERYVDLATAFVMLGLALITLALTMYLIVDLWKSDHPRPQPQPKPLKKRQLVTPESVRRYLNRGK